MSGVPPSHFCAWVLRVCTLGTAIASNQMTGFGVLLSVLNASIAML